MQSIQKSIDDLNKYTVVIKDKESGETHGTGVIVTDDVNHKLPYKLIRHLVL